MTNSALLIAYHFPPAAMSSGHLRTLSFSRYLPEFGWRPIVLSAHPRSYARVDMNSVSAIPAELSVHRAFALDVRKHFSFRGSYPVILAQPDRWNTWWIGAVLSGLRLIKRHKPKVIWSTYPIPTAHLIGCTLSKLSGLPWIADFRDPVSDTDLGSNELTLRTRSWVERRTIAHAARAVFTTDGAARLYAERYSSRDSKDFVVIPNGYDEIDFEGFPSAPAVPPARTRRLTLLHSGVLYRRHRDPTAFLSALADLRTVGKVSPDSLQVIFRASGHEQAYQRVIEELGLADMVLLRPPIPYGEALKEQYEADGLLLFQGAAYNLQIPAKVYEYLRMGKPIFALTDPNGDTAATLGSAGTGSVVPMDSKEAIVSALQEFITGLQERTLPVLPPEQVVRYSRRSRVEELAVLFDQVSGMPGGKP